VRTKFAVYMEEVHDQVNITAISAYQVPLQENESDCGLFLLHYIRKFVEQAPHKMRYSDLDGNWKDLGVVSSQVYDFKCQQCSAAFVKDVSSIFS